MKVLRYAVLMAFALAIPAAAQAQWQDVLGTKSTTDITQNALPENSNVGPYVLYLGGNGIGGEAIDFYCTELGQYIYPWTNYSATMKPISLLDTSLRARYTKAAWLTMQFGKYEKSEWETIHTTLRAFVAGDNPDNGFATMATTAYDNDWSAAGFVWADLGQNQDGIVYLPEPGSMLLLLSGLVGIAGVVVRRRIL